MAPSGVINVSDVRLAAPRAARATSGGGLYRPDGTIDLRLAGDSSDYGPLAVRVTGRASAPRIEVAAASPGYGLTNLTANVRADGAGLGARGARRFGLRAVHRRRRHPVQPRPAHHRGQPADLCRDQLRRPHRADQRAGPFAGTLTLEGQGLTGSVDLAAAGRRQQIAVTATANGARTPGDNPIIVQRGRVQVDDHLARRRSRSDRHRRRRRACGARQRRSVRPARPRRYSTSRAATAPPSSSPRGGAASPSASPPTAGETGERGAARHAGPGQQHPLPLRPARAACGARRRRLA